MTGLSRPLFISATGMVTDASSGSLGRRSAQKGCDSWAVPAHARVIIHLQGRPRVSPAWQSKQSRALPVAWAQVCSEDESDERNIGRR